MCLFVVCVHNVTSTVTFDTGEEARGEGSKISSSFPDTINFNAYSMLFSSINFATGCTEQENARAPLAKTFMDVEAFFHFSIQHSNMSSNVL